MTIEVRYVIFSPEEAQSAISSFLIGRGHRARPGDIAAITTISDGEHPFVNVAFSNAREPATVEPAHLVAAFLLFCRHNKIPIPRLAEKRIEVLESSFVLVLTTDKSGIQSKPVLKDGKLMYGLAAGLHEVNDLRFRLSRALASITQLENETAESRDRLKKSETVNTELSTMLKTVQKSKAHLSAMMKNITDMPGIRGIFGRGLIDADVGPELQK